MDHRFYFMNKAAIKAISDKDEKLAQIIELISYPEIPSTHNVFHDLMSCIIEQQIHYRSTKKQFQKMLDRAELEVLNLENFEVFEQKGFEGVKLNARKYETIINIVEFFSNNKIAWNALEDSEVKSRLAAIKGVGPWTIDMILLYTLERPNVFPADDYHLKQIMSKLYALDASAGLKAQMKGVAKLWSPNRSIATLYLLAWKDAQKKGLIP